jgi:hypothetical protein
MKMLLDKLMGFWTSTGSKTSFSSSTWATKRSNWPTAAKHPSKFEYGENGVQYGLLDRAGSSLSFAASPWISSATWEGVSMLDKYIHAAAALGTANIVDTNKSSIKRLSSKQIAANVANISPSVKPKECVHQRTTTTFAISHEFNHRGSVTLETSAALEVQALPYQSVISLAMPPRPCLLPGSPIPEPDPSNLPFGDTEDYQDSMIIHYVDELQMTYVAAAERYSEKFPCDTLNAKGLRKRHIHCLMRLKKRFGVKTEQELAKLRDVNSIVRNRGSKHRKRVSETENVRGTVITSSAPAKSMLASTNHGTKSPELNTQVVPRPFEKTCIVVWRDAEALSWKEIRNRLEEKYQWKLGKTNVKKHYNFSLSRVYGVGRKNV